MPITKSAKKALRQSVKHKALNLRYKRDMKEKCKNMETLCAEGKKKEAKKLLPDSMRAIDKAAKKGIIKKSTAARKKSRMSRISS